VAAKLHIGRKAAHEFAKDLLISGRGKLGEKVPGRKNPNHQIAEIRKGAEIETRGGVQKRRNARSIDVSERIVISDLIHRGRVNR